MISEEIDCIANANFKSEVHVETKMPEWEMKEEIVISGISGRYPDAENIDELRDNLLNHVDMISEDERRWPAGKI
jgi:hypothetical protein